MFKLYNIINSQLLGWLSPGQIAVGLASTRYHRCLWSNFEIFVVKLLNFCGQFFIFGRNHPDLPELCYLDAALNKTIALGGGMGASPNGYEW